MKRSFYNSLIKQGVIERKMVYDDESKEKTNNNPSHNNNNNNNNDDDTETNKSSDNPPFRRPIDQRMFKITYDRTKKLWEWLENYHPILHSYIMSLNNDVITKQLTDILNMIKEGFQNNIKLFNYLSSIEYFEAETIQCVCRLADKVTMLMAFCCNISKSFPR